MFDDLFDEVIDFEIIGGFKDDSREGIIKRAEELGIDINDYEYLEDLKEAVESLE